MMSRTTHRSVTSGLIALGAGATLALAACGGGSGSDSVTLSYSSPLGEDAPQNVLVQRWADRIEDSTDGRLAVQSYYGGSLLTTEDSVPGAGDGRADLSMASPQYHPGELKISSVTELPFVTGNAEAITLAVRDAYEAEEAFRAEWHAMGVEVLLFLPTGANVIVTNEAMDDIDDMNGMSLRAVGRTAAALEAVGATPRSVPIHEAYEGLERGLFQGVSSISANVADQIGVLEAAPNVYDAGFGEYTIIVLVANKQWYDGLDDDLRSAIEDSSQAYYDEVAEVLGELEAELCDELRDQDVEFHAWSSEEAQRWDDAAGDSIREAWSGDVAQGGLDAESFLTDHLERVATYEADSSYEPLVSACAAR